MAAPLTTPPLPPPEAPRGVQPGGVGFFVRCELLWAQLRRWYLRRYRPGHVERWHKLRQGACPNCPHDVVDSRDLKFVQNVCGWRFRPEGDVYASREGLGFARWGYAELIGFTVVFAALGGVLVVATQRLHWLFVILLLATWAAIVGVVWFFRDLP